MTITKKHWVLWSLYWILSLLTGLFYPSFANISTPKDKNIVTDTISTAKYDAGATTSSKNYLINDISLDFDTCIQETADTIYPAYGTHSLFTLVDKKHAVEAPYGPSDLILLTPSEYPVQNGLYVSQSILPDLMNMINDMKTNNLDIIIRSGWRTMDTQERMYNLWIDRVGVEKASYYAAQPNHSEHHLGTAIDIGQQTGQFTDSNSDHWLRANAYKYGFIMSYPEGFTNVTGYAFEPWHYRYVGIDAATAITTSKTTLSEYLYQYHNICVR